MTKDEMRKYLERQLDLMAHTPWHTADEACNIARTMALLTSQIAKLY
nr:MAG TPA: hypothetical protein [Caudoviricetes sp.]